MLSNIVGLYVTWNNPNTALQIKWIETAIRQSGDYFDDELTDVVRRSAEAL